MLALIFFNISAIGNGSDAKRTQAVGAKVPPVLDGKLDDGCWRNAQWITGFVQIYSGGPAEHQTRGKIIYDSEYLYIGVDADEPRMDLVKEAAAASEGRFDYGSGETIEIFLRNAGTPDDFLQVLANTNGTLQTCTTREMQLRNLGIENAVHIRDSGFSIEVKIPFSAMHLRTGSGKIWGFNLCRARMIIKDEKDDNLRYSSWSHTKGGFRQPDRFGEMEIAEDFSQYLLEIEPSLEAGRIELKIANKTGRRVSLRMEIDARTSAKTSFPVELVSNGTSAVDVPVSSAADFQMDVIMRDESTEKILYRGGFSNEEISSVSPIAPEKEAADTADDMGYTVFSLPWMERGNHLTLPDKAHIGRSLAMFGSPGEYLPASFSVRPSKKLEKVTVEIAGNLVNSGNNYIPAENVAVRTVVRMKRWISSMKYEQVETYLPIASIKDLSDDMTHRYWVTVKIPGDAAAGVYKGTIRISPSNAPACNLPVSVDVSPVQLAPAENMNYFMYFRPTYLPEQLRTEEFLRMCFEDMREHGMTSASLYGYPCAAGWIDVNRDRQEGISMARQMSLMKDTGLLKPWSKVIWIGAEVFGASVWKHVQESAREQQWNELLFYMIDEVGGKPQFWERLETLMKSVSGFREQYPELAFRTVTAGPLEKAHYYDVAIEGAGTSPEQIFKLEKAGKEVWSYDCGLAPVDAHTDRYYFGMFAWKTGIKGASHWAYYDGGLYNRFGTSAEWRGSHEDMIEYTHRYNFVYPSASELIPSIGWEAVRQGIYDYRYLLTLKRSIELAQLKGAEVKTVKPALALLAEIEGIINPDALSRERIRAREMSNQPGSRPDIRDFERRPPQPEFTAEKYDELRRRITEEIMRLNRAGYTYLYQKHQEKK